MSRTAYIQERDLKNYQRKLRRQKEIRRRSILMGIAVVLVMFLALSCRALLTHANTELENVSYKYYTSVQIEPGDTLWGLADRYADDEHYASREQYITEVMNMNHLIGEHICAGDYLVVPYYSPEFVK